MSQFHDSVASQVDAELAAERAERIQGRLLQAFVELEAEVERDQIALAEKRARLEEARAELQPAVETVASEEQPQG